MSSSFTLAFASCSSDKSKLPSIYWTSATKSCTFTFSSKVTSPGLTSNVSPSVKFDILS